MKERHTPSIEVVRAILVHLKPKAWPVTLDFELLFPVHHRLHNTFA